MRSLRVAVVLVVLLGLVAVVRFTWALSPPGPRDAAEFVSVRPGTSLRALARELEARGAVRDARALVLWGRARGVSKGLKAGRYRLEARESARTFLDKVVRGDTIPIRVSFFEGIWASEVVSLLADSLPLEPADVESVLSDTAFLADMGIPVDVAEGYLFPATYEFNETETARSALAKLIEEGRRRWDEAAADRADALGLSRHDVLTLASIIEAETGRPEERALVSAVYHRRLRRPMLLQADPTIVYGMGERGRKLLLKDLEADSPYNTYRRMGLPPTPIGNPGQAAIDAALYPDTTTSALYFVARKDGTHIFSNSFQEHRQAIQESRR